MVGKKWLALCSPEKPEKNRTMISAVSWVPRGVARADPIKYEPTEEELDMARAEAAVSNELVGKTVQPAADDEDDDDDDETMQGTSASDVTVQEDDDELPPEFNMDTYDDDDEDLPTDMMMEDEQDDPNFTVPLEELDSDEDDDEAIKPSDAILLAAHAEDDYSCLEVYVYDADQGSLYVHHDVALPAFPLALAWSGYVPYSSIEDTNTNGGNFVAVGTFEPGIEIWNLDVMEALTPTATLGGRETVEEAQERAKSKKKKKGKKGRSKSKPPLLPALRAGSHKDAVLGLSWNQQQRHILASGSADHVVKIWDLSTCQCLASLTHHKDKVQAVQWHPLERTVLATGSYDGTVTVLDIRSPTNVTSFPTSADIESLQWNPHNPATFAVSTEDGNVTLYDARQNQSPLFTLHAHEATVSSVTFNALVPDMMATSSVDKSIKIWDIAGNTPVCVETKSMGVGDVFCVSYYQDDPFLLACGGEDGKVALWETAESTSVSRKFRKRARDAMAANEEGNTSNNDGEDDDNKE
jgi:periodic tryptophan protein 1